jgi:hypothetical protein
MSVPVKPVAPSSRTSDDFVVIVIVRVNGQRCGLVSGLVIYVTESRELPFNHKPIDALTCQTAAKLPPFIFLRNTSTTFESIPPHDPASIVANTNTPCYPCFRSLIFIKPRMLTARVVVPIF